MRRRLVALAVAPLLVFGAACGSDSGGADDAEEEASAGTKIEGVTVTGDPGKVPEVKIETPLKVDKSGSQVIQKGDGSKVVEGEQALLHLYLAGGNSGRKAATTYDSDQPQALTMADDAMIPGVVDGLVDQPVGSRVLVALKAADAYGAEGNPQMGIAPDEPVVFVIDILGVEPTEKLEEPDGEKVDAPATLPGIVEKEGNVTKLTFDQAPKKPGKKLEVVTLIEGDGPPAREKSLVTFDYFGQVYGTEKVFDESFSKEPVTFALGANQLIPGWDEGLVGVKRGSRVMIIAPPEYGYGAQGNKGAGIKGTDTLAFVVDILGVS